MTNLFMIFDPISKFSFNWMSLSFFLILTPLNYWLIFSRWSMLWFNILLNFYKNFKLINHLFLNKIFIYINLMSLIFFCNLMNLFPYIFPSPSHLIFSLSMAMPLWLSFMIWSHLNNMNHMLNHFVPQSTPIMLIPLMIYIELISNIIRPLTLMIRLTANIITGHLLMFLLNKLNFSMILLIILINLMMILLEVSISFIQALVFSMLTFMYSKEIE
uniref:ATP synthase subunit a n=1 Tax=Syrbatus sp. 1 RRMO-2024a TaxID=3154167 RepID=A0AAU7LKR4_9COLE